MTFALTIPDEVMEKLYIQSGIYDRTKLCNQMVSFYQWAVDEACEGSRIVAENTERDIKTILHSDTFDNIKRRRQKYDYESKRHQSR
ncbi:hypothetical protein [Chitinophaga deserti]|uniref:hypothetical protein n=1 Tax=Chitinophaga deserti TaxID=2164099 RepID=UPI0013007757|nr:hypothetical protein [Chitinophaga deserti]